MNITAFMAFILTAAAAYLISGINPAIILSKAIYHTDIRTKGSGNPGFTNFKRVFGGKNAWLVFFSDILKGAVVSAAAGFVFRGTYGWQFGVAYTGIFAILGHAYPAFYGFRGGKGFLVCFSELWFIDWRAGAVAAITLVLLLLIVKIMSLSTMSALFAGGAAAAILGAGFAVCIMYFAGAVFVAVRHRENIKRLIKGTEPVFVFGKK